MVLKKFLTVLDITVNSGKILRVICGICGRPLLFSISYLEYMGLIETVTENQFLGLEATHIPQSLQILLPAIGGDACKVEESRIRGRELIKYMDGNGVRNVTRMVLEELQIVTRNRSRWRTVVQQWNYCKSPSMSGKPQNLFLP